ncbi:hypothetical protein P43SY_006092 [Pythium insidiosum]|uniref:Calmodulin n=1 Tax=Pythium insidiosum TaxID=114742 RepID=A0AAD5M048_PYTIN|nr:hypothetical protein P43SY_006092 [Pythium insidiosum]
MASSSRPPTEPLTPSVVLPPPSAKRPLVVPSQFRAFFSATEEEELVAQFQLSDADSSGAIDEREFRSLLERLSLHVSETQVSELVESIDTDGDGLIDFAELVAMVCRIKQGDSRLAALQSFVSALGTTPVALLEREATKFGLQVTYQLVESEPASPDDDSSARDVTPTVFVMRLTLAGKWCGPTGHETLQALGRTTREAKFRVAEAALARLRKLQPGLAFEPGALPPEWRAWLFGNMERGGNVRKLMQKLGEKGFTPARDGRVMQQISSRASSIRLRLKHSQRRGAATKGKALESGGPPIYAEEQREGDSSSSVRRDSQSSVKPHPTGLHPLWVHWARQELSRGIDGSVVLEELVAQGFEPDRFPALTQSFLQASAPPSSPAAAVDTAQALSPSRKSKRSAVDLPSSGPTPRPYSFWRCLEDGELAEVELFVFCGQDVNATQVDASTRLALSPLQLACKQGHKAIASFLLDRGADIHQRDAFHRTPLMLAAREGHSEICALLLAQQPRPIPSPAAIAPSTQPPAQSTSPEEQVALFALDALDNSPLHYAARSGDSKTVELLVEAHDARWLTFLAELPRHCALSYESVLRDAHAAVMKRRLRENERRKFHKSWCLDAAWWVWERLFQAQLVVPRPRADLMAALLDRYHDRFVAQRRANAPSDEDMIGAEADTGQGDDEEGEDDDEEEEDAGLELGVRQRKAAARAARREWIAFDQVAFLVDLCLRETFKHLPNKQGRTALHVACDENLVCTHELVIHRLAEIDGCDPELRDHAGATATTLLLRPKGRPGSPRGDWDAEQRLIAARRERVAQHDAARERARLEAKRQQWQHAVTELSADFQDLDVLTSAKKACLADAAAASSKESCCGWEIYAEPWSRNRLFVNAKSGFVQRQVPQPVVALTAQRLAWKETLELRAHFVEQHREAPEWEVHRVNSSDVYFFFNRVTTECSWVRPETAPARGWRTKRIFEDEEQYHDCLEDPEQQAALRLEFSGRGTAFKTDVVQGRRLGAWRECRIFGVTFYWRDDDAGDAPVVSIVKPSDVLAAEAARFAHVRLRQRSEEIETHHGGWRRWYDLRSAQSFYYDDDTGDCTLDVDADAAFRRRLRGPRRRRLRDSELTDDERRKRREEHEWKLTLERARRRDLHAQATQHRAAAEQAAVAEFEERHAAALRRLEMSVTSEHLAIESSSSSTTEVDGGPLSGRKSLGYVDARFQREREVWLDAQRFLLLVSMNPATMRPRHELERAETVERELDDQEREHAALEDEPSVTTPLALALRERRRVSRVLWRTAERLRRDLVRCRWGCGRWLPRVLSVATHERLECRRRRMICRLGCGLVLEDQQWQRSIYDHERSAATHCDSRIVACPRDCGVFLPQLRLATHMSDLCVRRPIGDLCCRLGCGAVYQGGAHELLALEQQREAHEQDDCELRKVECTWPRCRGVILARDRDSHRRLHLISSGIATFLTADVHEYKVPRDVQRLKIQAWGAGGGAGHLRGQTGGHGGGGAFVEAVCRVHPGETLYFAIGHGGAAGQYAQMKEVPDEEGIALAAERTADGSRTATASTADPGRRREARDRLYRSIAQARVDTTVSSAAGGHPGGGVGHSGNKESACGGGGGFTSVYRNGAFGIEYVLIAAGGGGGGTCRHGDGGGGVKARAWKDGDDRRMGRPGDAAQGGRAGICDEHNPVCRFVGTDGGSLQGGDGAEFGGGGGGGLYGGGGGGFAPGVVGGGGGGSSFVNLEIAERGSVVVLPGLAPSPGGLEREPPRAVRDAYWDVVDAVVGEGGKATPSAVASGNHGGVRLAKPGFFQDMHHYR